MNTAVLGASGYAGGELLRLLSGHPDFELTHIAAGTNAGEPITQVHPQLTSFAGRLFESTSPQALASCDLIFMALPHGESAKVLPILKDDQFIVDLGADFRLANAASWEKYYGGTHAGTWAYGLPELKGFREQIVQAKRVANPGCYATAIALGTAPMLSLVDYADVTVVAASGTTGAGRGAKVSLLGSEVMNSLTSYKFGGVHQHTPEIEESLGKLVGDKVKISFTPILAPMPRGILATITAKLHAEIDSTALRAIFSDYYDEEEFVTVLPEGQLPKTSSVLGSNHAQLQVAVDHHTSRAVVSIAIDNLGKGAAAQAIQNANLITGADENLGLSFSGVGA